MRSTVSTAVYYWRMSPNSPTSGCRLRLTVSTLYFWRMSPKFSTSGGRSRPRSILFVSCFSRMFLNSPTSRGRLRPTVS